MKKWPVLALLYLFGVCEVGAQCVLVRDGGPMPEIRQATSSTVVGFAAEELNRYLGAMTGSLAKGPLPSGLVPGGRERTLKPNGGSGVITLAIDPSLGWDAFQIEVSKTSVRITGGNDRGVLFGAYQLLKDLGCAFLAPGPGGENVPRKPTLSLRMGKRTFRPALRYRGLIVQRPMTEGNLLMADWMAKNQMNYWVNPHWVFDTAAPDLRARFVDALETRGILWEYGHHTFARWISRGAPDPETLGLKDGVRTPAAVCMSQARAAERVAQNMADFVAEWPQVDVLSLWPNDTVNGWCECDPCRILHGDLPVWRGVAPLMTRPYLWFVDRVAENLAGRGVRQPITALAYKNTIEPVEGIATAANVRVTIAPIDRSYARPLAEVDYFGPIVADWTDRLGERSAASPAGARVMAYEYYAGQYMNNSLPMPAVTALSDDIDDFRRSGFGGITIQAEEGPWGTYVLDYYALARMSYRGPEDPGRLIGEFSGQYYGAAAAPMAEYWTSQEALIRTRKEVGAAGQFFHLLRATPGAIERLDELVTQAEILADTPVVRDRVHLSRLSVEYVKRLRDAIEAGRDRLMDTLPPTPKGTGYLNPPGVGEFVQLRLPVPREGGVEFAFGNVVPTTGGGSSYQIEVRRDGGEGAVLHLGRVFSGTPEQVWNHEPGRDWAKSNRTPVVLTPWLQEVDRDRGWLDVFVTAHVTGDSWTLYRDHDDGGPWDMKASMTVDSPDDDRAIAWERLRSFVEEHANSGIFNYAPDFVLSVCKRMIEESR